MTRSPIELLWTAKNNMPEKERGVSCGPNRKVAMDGLTDCPLADSFQAEELRARENTK